ncbi:LOW QUALITY PROTEIN: BRCA1-A complex subunit RAP80 [Hyla sarda]|uniref:LOW QUALITY PROTEIN: BRCA1-A complex subunit RAP80 n=1 Tax=Hyla sarda TaxID=327740 RepID=UPI0024C271E9|nr:LOW QUALITY PROTEIN: BRCA1-A complex subunit RAP80 [Hyla sarda]
MEDIRLLINIAEKHCLWEKDPFMGTAIKIIFWHMIQQVLMRMHHRRRQRFSEGTCQQYVIDDEESTLEPTISVGSENRTDNEESSIVISDSDDVELQVESILPKKRRRPPLQRKPLTVKRKIAHMTEEEQLALAVKISQQEQTKQEKYTQEEEEELIKKAIEESLHSCQVPDIPVSEAKEELTNKTPSSEEGNVNDHKEEPHLSKASAPSAGDSPKSPFVILQRLSQDIVESSSVILSPNCRDPVSCIETSRQSPLSPCTSSDFIKMSPAKGIALSPVFPKRTPCSGKLIPCRLFLERSTSADQPVDDVDDQCTHCSESSQMGSSSLLPTSPIENSYQTDSTSTKTLNIDKAKDVDCEDAFSVDGIASTDCRSNKSSQSGGTVHYYWGVPFCPKGVDPSEYTKVILCQLEVYQKSLKTAQRQLVHKVDYGEPIHLVALSKQNVKDEIQGNISHEDIGDSTAEDDTQKPEDGEKESGDNSDSQQTERQYVASKRQKISQSPVQIILEHDLKSLSSDGKEKTPLTKLLPSECTEVALVAPGESAVSPTAVRNDRHLMEHTEIAQEEEITICPETQPSPAKQEGSDKGDQPEEMETAPQPQVSLTACISSEPSDEDLICLDKINSKNVTCPMCGCDFSQNQIERHAAYCDGTNGQLEMTVLRPRNKLRRGHDSSPVGVPSADSGKCETCYLCKSLVPLKNYQAHVDNCLQTAMLSTPGSQRLRSSKQEYPGRNCRLLSMLEQSESSLAGTSNAPEPSNLSPPREEHDDRFNSENLNLGDSPIRSFVSISEVTDCLVDFKKQLNHQPSSRRATHRGRRRRM